MGLFSKPNPEELLQQQLKKLSPEKRANLSSGQIRRMRGDAIKQFNKAHEKHTGNSEGGKPDARGGGGSRATRRRNR